MIRVSGLENTIAPEDVSTEEGVPSAFEDFYKNFVKSNAAEFRANLDSEGDDILGESFSPDTPSPPHEGVSSDEGVSDHEGVARSGTRLRSDFS